MPLRRCRLIGSFITLLLCGVAGWALPKNRIDFWTRVEKFLDRNIGKP
jgi:hypothetical protein